MRSAKKNERGQAIVEFALALPVLLIILCGILDFGWIYVNQFCVETAAHTAARCAAIHASNEESLSEYLSEAESCAKDNLIYDNGSAIIYINVQPEEVCASVDYSVKTLTFVAGMLFGDYYQASSASAFSY